RHAIERRYRAPAGTSPATRPNTSPTRAICSGVRYIALLNVKPVKPASMYGRRPSAACSGPPLGRDGVEERLCLGLGADDDDRRADRPLDRGRVAPDLLAVALEHLGLVLEGVEADREPVGHVGVLRRDPE